MSNRTRKSSLIAIGVFAVVAPFLLRTPYAQHVLILVLLYITLGSAWNVLGGFAGQLSLGHAAFFGIGAYAAAVLSSKTSVSPWFGLIVGPLTVLPLAVVVGWVCFRLRGPYFSLATIAVGEVLRLAALNWRGLTGGAVGVVVRQTLFDGVSKIPYYFVILAITAGTVALCYAISKSKLGYYFIAIREDQETAESIGIDTTRYKLAALAISATLTALAGAFYANYFLFVDPTIVLPLTLSVEIVLMGIIGGLGRVGGPVLGAVLLRLSSEGFRNLTAGTKYEQASLLIYGVLLIIVILFMPDGLMGGVSRWLKKEKDEVPRAAA